jgi:hypothetical protein
MPVLSTLGAATAKAWGFLQQVASAVADPYFNYVTMLLTGDGTNGAQNNTFLDSSTNNFTITRNGNTTQGSFSPYGANWSNYFDGTGDYLTTPSISLSGDFTIEGWFFRQSGNNYFFTVGDSATASGIEAYVGTGGTVLNLYSNSNAEITATPFATTTWSHLAVVRSGTTITMYVNGTSVGTWTSSATFSGTVYVGAEFYSSSVTGSMAGYISNFRIVNGTAVYTTTFTPSTTPLTAITNTQLLTCQSNRFIDNSTNAYTVTVNGNTSVQRFSPFSPTASYDTATIGGSGYFDGTGDYLTSSSGNIGTGDFTIEGWFYFTTTPDTMGLFQTSSTAGGFAPNQSANLAVATASSSTWQIYAKNTFTTSSSTSVPVNAWGHMALVRSGTTTVLYINGAVVITLTSDSTNYSTANMGLGGIYDNSSYLLNGFLSSFRVVVGTAVYTSAFTPPTAPLTAISGTSLLTNFTNAGIPDSAMMNDLETVGNAQVSTSVKKYGTGSLAFDGTGDFLLSNLPTTNLCAFGTGAFTIEFWLYINTTSGYQVLYDSRNGAAGAYTTIYLNGATLTYEANNAAQITAGSGLSTSTWYHIAVARSGTSTKMFINGTQTGSTYTDSTNYLCDAKRPVIGADGANTANNNLNGYIDDLRVTKGYARYTSNFTAPTAAFPTF